MASCVALNALSLAPARTVVTVRRAARASPRSRVVLVRAADAPDLSVGGAKALKSKEKKKLKKLEEKAARKAAASQQLQKPRVRKAASGEKKPDLPPTAAEIAASEKYDAMVAEGGVVFECFIRAKGPNQWFPVGPMAVKQAWMIVPEMWKAEEPLRKAGMKMYPGLAAAPCFGKVEYGYRERDDEKKITEEQIRENAGKMNPFDDVILLERGEGESPPPEKSWKEKLDEFMNPYGTGKKD
jgi:hypothetical protein